MSTWPVEILDGEQWRAWRDGVRGYEAQQAKVKERGKTPVHFGAYQDGRRWFQWVCPSCGSCPYGEIGDIAVGGWDGNQRWTVDGHADALTMQPSLGCPNWRDGTCPDGHWWLRNGELVTA